MWNAWRRSGVPVAGWLAPAASALALGYGLRGEAQPCRLWQDRATQARGTDNPALARHGADFAAFVDARLAVHTGTHPQAPLLVERAVAASTGWCVGYARAAAAELAVIAGLPAATELLARAAVDAAENAWAAACLARAAARLRSDAAALGDAVRRWRRIGAHFEWEQTRRLLPAEPGA